MAVSPICETWRQLLVRSKSAGQHLGHTHQGHLDTSSIQMGQTRLKCNGATRDDAGFSPKRNSTSGSMRRPDHCRV
jgi:hypothetical protein